MTYEIIFYFFHYSSLLYDLRHHPLRICPCRRPIRREPVGGEWVFLLCGDGIAGATPSDRHVPRPIIGRQAHPSLRGKIIDERRFALLVRVFFATAAVTGSSVRSDDQFREEFSRERDRRAPDVAPVRPDNKLYVAQQDGRSRSTRSRGTGRIPYSTTATQTITLVKDIPNHDDDGALNAAVTSRLCTVWSSPDASNPVIYVSSSDPRIGGSTEGDLNLDTNSGIISKLTWNGSSWQKIDLVRALARSEENHLTNGMQLNETTNTPLRRPGRQYEHGARRRTNFVFSPRWRSPRAYVAIDSTRSHTTYDCRTLKNTATPFGGQDGLNQAKLVPNGPVQVYAPGFRNPYDLVITTKNRLYTTYAPMPDGEEFPSAKDRAVMRRTR